MKHNWLLIYDKYEGLYAKAVDTVSGFVSGHFKRTLEAKSVDNLSETDLTENNVVYIGGTNNYVAEKIIRENQLSITSDNEGFTCYAGKSFFTEGKQSAAVISDSQVGALYGANELVNVYFGSVIYTARPAQRYEQKEYFENIFVDAFPTWKVTCTPKIKTRAAWTWGDRIYDFKKYFDNLAKLKFNEVVIWNDFIPLNAKEVVTYAHSLGIKIIWGFSWGWELSNDKESQLLEKINDGYLQTLREAIVKKYQDEYAKSEGDGIYFQTFTENKTEKIGDKTMAEIITEFINLTANQLLEKFPDLEIQFGIHATSVKEHFVELSKIDKRIAIIWEDCGAFPYSYNPSETTEYDKTMQFVDNIINLRGESEKFGSVLKSMVNLDWNNFAHQKGRYVLGVKTQEFMNEKQHYLNKIWKMCQAEWIQNCELFRKFIENVSTKNPDSNLQILLEDSLMETGIPFPLAFFAQTLWDYHTPALNTVATVAKYPCVKFFNF